MFKKFICKLLKILNCKNNKAKINIDLKPTSYLTATSGLSRSVIEEKIKHLNQ